MLMPNTAVRRLMKIQFVSHWVWIQAGQTMAPDGTRPQLNGNFKNSNNVGKINHFLEMSLLIL